MKKMKKSTWIASLLFIYATVLFVYYFVWRGAALDIRNIGVMAVTYLLVLIVWYLNRRREKEKENNKFKM